LFLIGQQVWENSSGIGPCFPLAGGLCKFKAMPEENDQYSGANHSLYNTSSKPINFFNEQLYSTCD
jgi:hypothetical protein